MSPRKRQRDSSRGIPTTWWSWTIRESFVGIITTYDLSKAIARPGRAKKVRDIMTTRVITTNPDEHVDIVARKLERYNVSALPVVDPDEKVLGMLTAINLGKLFGGRWLK